MPLKNNHTFSFNKVFDRCDPENTTELVLSFKGITEIHESIQSLKNLEKLSAVGCQLKSLPDEIGHLKNLKELNLQVNVIKQLPRCLGHLTKLRELHLEWNGLSELPESIGNLVELTELNLSYNKLKTLPGSIGKLANLTTLQLNQNFLSELPTSFGKLKNLKRLSLQNNRLIRLPDQFSDLESLQVLCLQMNRLETLPDTIGNLSNLIELDLHSNKLRKMPSDVEKMSNLLILCLHNNRLSSLPQCFENLQNLRLLKLSGNPISRKGDTDVLGETDLRRIFGTRAVFGMAGYLFPVISVADVYEKLTKQRVFWNMEIVRQIRSAPIVVGTTNEAAVASLVETAYSRGIVNEENRDVILKYITKLFNPEIRYDGWAMYPEFSQMVIQMIVEVLNNLDRNLELASLGLELFLEAVKNFCPDRQIGELRIAHALLTNKILEDCHLDDFIRSIIAREKEYAFLTSLMPANSSENVHVLNYWKYELRDDIGIDFEFKTNIGTMGQDPFRGNKGNALDAFFSKFTPESIIKRIAEEINLNKPMMCEIMMKIANSGMASMVDVGMSDEYLRFDHITDEAVEFYLVSIKVICKRN